MPDANLSQPFVADLPLLRKKAIDYLPSSPCQCLQDVCQTSKPNLTYVQRLPADKPNAALFVLNLKLLHWSAALHLLQKHYLRIINYDDMTFLDALAFIELGPVIQCSVLWMPLEY